MSDDWLKPMHGVVQGRGTAAPRFVVHRFQRLSPRVRGIVFRLCGPSAAPFIAVVPRADNDDLSHVASRLSASSMIEKVVVIVNIG